MVSTREGYIGWIFKLYLWPSKDIPIQSTLGIAKRLLLLLIKNRKDISIVNCTINGFVEMAW